MTFSVTKTFLTTVVGLAWQKGLIRDVNDRVRGYMPAGVDLFEAPHNQPITWDHLLRQTSDWQGTLWGKPDWADRPGRHGGRVGEAPAPRARHTLRVQRRAGQPAGARGAPRLRRPLPQVLRKEIMEPIGASSTWRWYGYENSWIELDGTAGAVGVGRWALRRRHVHQCVRHGEVRLPVPAQRRMEGSAARFREMDPDGAHAGARRTPSTASQTGT